MMPMSRKRKTKRKRTVPQREQTHRKKVEWNKFSAVSGKRKKSETDFKETVPISVLYLDEEEEAKDEAAGDRESVMKIKKEEPDDWERMMERKKEEADDRERVMEIKKEAAEAEEEEEEEEAEEPRPEEDEVESNLTF